MVATGGPLHMYAQYQPRCYSGEGSSCFTCGLEVTWGIHIRKDHQEAVYFGRVRSALYPNTCHILHITIELVRKKVESVQKYEKVRTTHKTISRAQ